MTIGIVWNPSKIDGDELREAFVAAQRAVSGGANPAAEDGQTGDEAAAAPLWFETEADDPGAGATDAALRAGCSVIIAAGGDGTVRAVAEHLGTAESSGSADGEVGPVELGIVPLGTGNLLARNLGIPLGNPAAAFKRVLTGTASPLDLGEVTFVTDEGVASTQGFVVMAGFGIDAQMIVETDDDLKAKAGWLAYVESLGRAASGTEVVEFDLALDDAEPEREQAHTLLVANCGSLQGGVTLLPDAQPDDGELDLLLLRASDAGAWLDTMRNLAWDNGLKRLITGANEAESSASTGHLRASSVGVSLRQPLAFEIDGDDVGQVVEFSVRILPGALRVR